MSRLVGPWAKWLGFLVRTSVTVWAGERKKFCGRTKTPNNRETLSLFAFATHRFGRGGSIKMFRFESKIRFRNPESVSSYLVSAPRPPK